METDETDVLTSPRPPAEGGTTTASPDASGWATRLAWIGVAVGTLTYLGTVPWAYVGTFGTESLDPFASIAAWIVGVPALLALALLSAPAMALRTRAPRTALVIAVVALVVHAFPAGALLLIGGGEVLDLLRL
ncbi:hypothetical protein [Nocardioides bruguierae]|uniref:hypothetical protein n=1 Tax=Nocardioides bruguierae TaxID=2945102 RepID=UPI0020217F52|nr:hypothetical protein [Nocardioides bruguierae]MCL8023979.1 hypothetical protein [Nocardioides bruguierae]